MNSAKTKFRLEIPVRDVPARSLQPMHRCPDVSTDPRLRLPKGGEMKTTKALYLSMLAAGIAVVMAASLGRLNARQLTSGAVRVESDNIGGVVTGAKGPEA